MEKLFVTAFWFFLIQLSLHGQGISLHDADLSEYPLIKARLTAIDENQNQIMLDDIEDLSLFEDSVPSEIISISCPPPTPPAALSAVLAIDISSSMEGQGISIAKEAAAVWFEAMTFENSECAAITFNNRSYLNSDFVQSAELLLNSLENISTEGGTNYNTGLLYPDYGALQIAKRGKLKRIIVFLTDGLPTSNVLTDTIIDEALKYNTEIYCITLNMPVPYSLQQISMATGGKFFGNVKSAEEARMVYRQILYTAQNTSPCEIQWISSSCSYIRTVEIEYLPKEMKSSMTYYAGRSELKRLEILPTNSFDFGYVPPGSKDTAEFMLTAYADTVVISKIKINNPEIKLLYFEDKEYVLAPGNSLVLIAEFSPLDSLYTTANLEIINNGCIESNLYLSGGRRNAFPQEPTLKVLFPNGGENLLAGTDTLIIWDGILPGDTTEITYSTDKGKSWLSVEKNASGLSTRWKIPETPSNKCIMRIKQSGTLLKDAVTINTGSEVLSLDWSADSKSVVSSEASGSICIWDAESGELTDSLVGNINAVSSIRWSSDGMKIAGGCTDGSVYLWQLPKKEIILHARTNTSPVNSIKWLADNSLAMGCSDGYGKFLDINTGVITRYHYTGDTNKVYDIAFDTDNKYFSFALSNGSVEGWEQQTAEQIHRFNGHNGEVLCLDWAPHEYRIASGSKDATVRIWNTVNGNNDFIFEGHNQAVNDVSWHPNRYLLASASADGRIILWDSDVGKPLETLNGHRDEVNEARWSLSGGHLASCSADSTVRIWHINSLFNQDFSDSLWTITAPRLRILDVDMGNCFIGSSKDSTVTGFIQNNGKGAAVISEIRLGGINASEFYVDYDPGKFIIHPDSSFPLTIKFKPISKGFKDAKLQVITVLDTLEGYLVGDADNPILAHLERIDFGKVYIGKTKDTTIVFLENIGMDTVKIDSAEFEQQSATPFFTDSQLENMILAPGETKSLTVSFSPAEEKIYSEIFNIYTGSYVFEGELTGEGVSGCDETGFIYSDFSDASNLKINGDAYHYKNLIRLTADLQKQSGSVWYDQLLPLSYGFVTEFCFSLEKGANLGNDDGSIPGADGIAFVIQNDTLTAQGMNGGGIGYENIRNSLAIEFDTYANDEQQIFDYFDPNGNHCAVQTNRTESNTAVHNLVNTIAISSDILPLRTDGTKYFVKIDYDRELKVLLVYLDTLQNYNNPIITATNLKLEKILGLSQNVGAYAGFTASTGSAVEIHNIHSWTFCPKPNDGPITKVSNHTKEAAGVVLYPNPVRSMARLEFRSQGYSGAKIKLYNMYGELIFSEKINCNQATTSFNLNNQATTSFNLNTETLAPGAYIIIINTGGSTEAIKFIKTK